MIMSITYASKHPNIADDRAFFEENPHRLYRARFFQQDEIGLPASVSVFANDERGEVGETNLVILKRVKGGRIRFHFAAFADVLLNNDAQIEAFLRSRGTVLPRPDRTGADT